MRGRLCEMNFISGLYIPYSENATLKRLKSINLCVFLHLSEKNGIVLGSFLYIMQEEVNNYAKWIGYVLNGTVSCIHRSKKAFLL